MEEVDPNLGNFEGLETAGEELTADEVVIPRELELEVEPEDGTELLQSHHKTKDEDLPLTGEQKKHFLERWNLFLKML